jgi:hypothetical protein
MTVEKSLKIEKDPIRRDVQLISQGPCQNAPKSFKLLFDMGIS